MSAIEDLQLALAANVKVKPYLAKRGKHVEPIAGYLREGLPGVPGGPPPAIRRIPTRSVMSEDEQKVESYRSKGWSPVGATRMTKSNKNGLVEVRKAGEKWAVRSSADDEGPRHQHGEYDKIEDAVDRAEKLLKSRLRGKLFGGLSAEPGPALVQLARKFVGPYKRLSPTGEIVDVDAYWATLPIGIRKAILDEMHAPADPDLQTPDRPETRPLQDLPPGLRKVYEAVELQVGESKAAALREKVGDDTREAGYLHRLPTGPTEEQKRRHTQWGGPGFLPESSGGAGPPAPAYRVGERVNVTDFDGSVKAGTVTADSGYGSYVVSMDGETDVQQVDETAMSPETVDSPDPGRTVGFDEEAHRLPTAPSTWERQATSLSYEDAQHMFATGEWSPAQWEAFQYLWATSATRYSSLGQPVVPYDQLPDDVKRYVDLGRQFIESEQFARDSLRP